MAPVKCAYFMCGNSSNKISMFRFPVGSEILEQWLENCGNMELYHLSHDRLRHRFICQAHFDDDDISNPNTSSMTLNATVSKVDMHAYRMKNNMRLRIKRWAVPRHYKNNITRHSSSDEGSSDDESCSLPSTDRAASPDMEVLKPTKVYTKLYKKILEEPEIIVDFETLKRSQNQGPLNSVYHFTAEPMTSADGSITLLPKPAEYDSDDDIPPVTGFDTGDHDMNVDPLDTESHTPVDDPNLPSADDGKTSEAILITDKPITEANRPKLSMQQKCDDGSESDDNCEDMSESSDCDDGSKTQDNSGRANTETVKESSAPLSIDNMSDSPALVMDVDDDCDVLDSYMGEIDPPYLETTITIADLIIPNEYIRKPWRITLPDDVFKIPKCVYLARKEAINQNNKEKTVGNEDGVNTISDPLACRRPGRRKTSHRPRAANIYCTLRSNSNSNRPWRATLPDDNTDDQPTHKIAAQKNGQINIRKQNSEKPINKDKKYWKSKLTHILHSTQFCGICLCTEDTVHSLNDQFDIVVCDNTHTTTLADILHVVFRETEDLLSNSQICDICTNKLIQSYNFIRQAKETSQLLNLHLNNLYRKSCYIRNNLLGDTNDDQAKASHVVIDMDYKEYSNVSSSDNIKNSDIIDNGDTNENYDIIENNVMNENRDVIENNGNIENTDRNVNTDINENSDINKNSDITVLKDNVEYNNTEVVDKCASNVTENDAPVGIFEDNDNYILKDIVRNKNKDCVKKSRRRLLIPRSRLRVVGSIKDGNQNKTIIRNNGKGKDIGNPKHKVDKNKNCKNNKKNKTKRKNNDKQKSIQEPKAVEESKEIFQCKVCLLVFFDKQALNRHSVVHFDLRCKICHEVVEDCEIVSHLMEFHKNSARFCTICNVAFSSIQELKNHQDEWHYNANRTCLTCMKSCTEDELEQHQCRFGCGICDEVPCDHYKYLMHYREQILNGALRPKCLDCDYINFKKSALLLHINTHHLKLRPFICEVCKEKFYTKYALNMHFYKCHNHSFKCYQCNTAFNNWDIYRRHLSDSHMHRPFKCDKCPSSFFTSEAYENHEKTRHKKFSCDICKKVLSMKNKNNHMLHRHYKTKNVKECDICQKKFASKTELIKHIKLHMSARKYSCKVCKIEYNTLKEYKEHNPLCFVLCDLCGESIESPLLRKHQSNAHKQKVS